MGLFEQLFPKRKTVKGETRFEGLTTYQPVFTSWGGKLYESDLVRTAIDAKARHASKLKVEMIGAAQSGLKVRTRKGPNGFQTWGQFLYRVSTILDMEGTAFIIPTYNQYGEQTGYFPILPSRSEVVEYNGVVYLRYQFANRTVAAIEWSRCGVMTRFQYKSDFFGTNNDALRPTMELIHAQNQGIKEGVKNSATFRFIARKTNFTDEIDLSEEQKRFTEKNFSEDASGGMLLFPNTYDSIQQVHSRPYTIDAAQMTYIKTNVCNYFGVSEDILQNKAYGDKWSAFYEGAIEPFAIQLADVLTNMTYTPREMADGNYFAVTSNRLQYMSTADKLQVSAQMADRGILNRDEVREIWNLPPLPNGEGQAYIIRGEYYNADEKLNEDEELIDEEEVNDDELRSIIVDNALQRMGL